MATPPVSPQQMRLPLSRDDTGAAAAPLVTSSNLEAVAALDAFPNGAERVLALCGPAGAGKTVLAEHWAMRLGAIAIHGAEAAVIDPLELEGQAILLDRAEDADDETLFHLINLAQTPGSNGQGCLLLVGRQSPAQWATALPDLRSRLDAVRVVAVREPDDTLLRAALTAAFRRRSIEPSEEVLTYLVARIERAAGGVDDIVERLDALHRPITRALAREVLQADTPDLLQGGE
jgi:chromosomal replication initiation ATPase DnaA